MSAATVVPPKPARRTTPRLKEVRADAKKQRKSPPAPWDPREKDEPYGLVPMDRLCSFVTDKLYRSPVAIQVFLFLSKEIWCNIHTNSKKACPVWTRVLAYSEIAAVCRGPKGDKPVNEKTVRAILTWAIETRCIEEDKVGRSYRFALNPPAWKTAAAFDPDVYMPAAPEKDDEEDDGPDEDPYEDDAAITDKSEQEAKYSGSMLPKSSFVVFPGKRQPIPLGRALHVQQTVFDGMREDQDFIVRVESSSGRAISCAAELETGGIRVRIADHSEQMAKHSGSMLPESDLEGLSAWLSENNGDAALEAVAKRLQAAAVPADWYMEVGAKELLSMRLKRKPTTDGFFVWIAEEAAKRWPKAQTARAGRKAVHVVEPELTPREREARIKSLRSLLADPAESDRYRDMARAQLADLGVAV
jgi:hypothetical protein